MKRGLVIFLLLACIGSAAQVVMLARRPKAAGGPGPPGVYATGTNAGLATTSLDVTIDSGTDPNRVMIFVVGYYEGSGNYITNLSFNSVMATNNLIVKTNNTDYTEGGYILMYYLTAPDAGTFTASVKFNTTIDEASFHVIALTNAAQTSPSRYAKGRHASSATTNYVNDITTSTLDIIIGAVWFSDDPVTITPRTGQTLITHRGAGAGTHTVGTTTMIPTTSNATNGWAFNKQNYIEAIAASIKSP